MYNYTCAVTAGASPSRKLPPRGPTLNANLLTDMVACALVGGVCALDCGRCLWGANSIHGRAGQYSFDGARRRMTSGGKLVVFTCNYEASYVTKTSVRIELQRTETKG